MTTNFRRHKTRYQPRLELLEDRLAPATFAEAGTLLNLDFNVASKSVAIVSAGTTYALTLTGDTWSGTNSANVTGNGTSLLTVTAAGLAAFNAVNLTDSAAGSAVNFNNSGANAYSDSFNVALDDAAAGAITFNGSSSFTLANSISASTTRNIAFASGSSLTTVDGGITLSANQQATPTTGNFIGIDVNAGLIQATGTGAVTVQGKGGLTSGSSQIGVRVQGGGDIIGGTSGLLTVQGTGGASTGGLAQNDHGVNVTGIGSTITSSGGNVSVSGTGGGVGNSSNHCGVLVQSNGQITAGGSGTVTVVGQGGNSSIQGQENNGVQVSGFSAIPGSGGTITSSGGNVSVTGTGGGSGTNSNHYGVAVVVGGQITAGGSGTVTVVGQGGSNTGAGGLNNYGVLVSNANATITSNGGNVSVNGTGGGGVGSSNNIGVRVDTLSQITAGGSGTVTVVGQGSLTATGGGNFGVWVFRVGATITSSGGNVSVTGTGGGADSSNANYGVDLLEGGHITAGATGTVTVVGQGGNLAGTGEENLGVALSGPGATITSGGGNVSVTGTEGGGTGSIAIDVISSGPVNSSGAITTAINGGTVTLIGNSMNFDFAAIISASSSSSVTLRQSTNNVAIDLGAATDPSGGPLSLTDAELDRVTAGTLIIGDSNSGPITISAAITRPASTNVELHSGAAIIFNPGSFNSAGGTLLLSPGPGGVQPITAGTDATASTVSFASDLSIAINGATVDTEYSQFNVNGIVDLTGVDLVLTGPYVPVASNVFVIVSATSRTGLFTGLAENDVVTFNGKQLRVNYTSTTVTLTTLDAPPSPIAVTINQAGGQADPTNTSPIQFTVVFSSAVTGFSGSDVSLADSTVGGTLVASVSGSGANYTVSVTGMTGSGTIVASIGAGAAVDANNTASAASTSTDNSVTFAADVVAPTVTINQAAGQADPTRRSPIRFTVVFSSAVTGFTGSDVSFAGSTVGGTLVASVSGSGANYTVSVTGMTGSGTVVASIGAGAAMDANNTSSAASTSTDNTVTVMAKVPRPRTLTITLVGRQTSYNNVFGLYFVDDARGRIGTLVPGDPGYARAALGRTKAVFTNQDGIGARRTMRLPVGRFYGMYLIQNTSRSVFLARNPQNRLGQGPLMFFSFAAANPDGVRHVRRPSATRFAFEDLTGGGDKDFNDLVVDVRIRRRQSPSP